ncbi:MAG TPA: tol-pal system protein YbgF, partial [Burkholderiales bacterium]|nr:tol-pal system protein YbgF [Burkholderiales bacterium]
MRQHINRVAKCGAVLLFAAIGATAHAGMFDDDEARKQIAAERKRIDDVKAQQQAVDARLNKMEEAFKSQALLDLFSQIEALKLEMNKLR